MVSENRGILLVVSAPSGCGKDSVISQLKKINTDVKQSISMTTRKIRPGEVDGVDYYFTDTDDFKKKIDEGYFLEYVNYGGNFYGTPKKKISDLLNECECVLLKIEVEGAGNVRKAFPDAVSVFIVPPSLEELKIRLKNRGTETEEQYTKRVEIASTELSRACEYNYIVINDKIEKCADEINGIIDSEKHRYSRMKDFVENIK